MFKFNIRFDDTFNLAPYNKSLRCYSVIMMDGNERHNVNKGGKSNDNQLFFNLFYF